MQLPWRSLRTPAVRRVAEWHPTGIDWLVSLLAGVFVAQQVNQFLAGGADPIADWAALGYEDLRHGQVWRLGSNFFLGNGIWADCGVLVALYVTGRPLESIIGRRHLWQLFLIAGTLGGLSQLAVGIAEHAPSPAQGPEAAVAAIVFALTSIMPDLELAPLMGLPLPARLRLKHGVLAAVLGCAVALSVPAGHAYARQEAVRILSGCIAGWLYLWLLGFGRSGAPSHAETARLAPVAQRASRLMRPGAVAGAHPPRFTERELRMTPRQYISEQIDPILDKICLHGIASLTIEEKRLLEKGRDKMTQEDA
jgi:membrane associated rhomboid family serine protease